MTNWLYAIHTLKMNQTVKLVKLFEKMFNMSSVVDSRCCFHSSMLLLMKVWDSAFQLVNCFKFASQVNFHQQPEAREEGLRGEETGHVPPTLTEVGPGNASNFRLASCRHQNASNSFCARAPPRTLVGAHNFLRLCPCIAISWPMDIRLPNLIMVFYFIMFTCSPSFTLAALHHLMYMYIHTMC